MAAALNRIAQAAHSWRPEEARRFAEQAWQDPNPHHSAASDLVSSSPTNNTPTTDKDGESMRFYRSYSTAASVSSKFRQICLLFILFFFFFRVVNKFVN